MAANISRHKPLPTNDKLNLSDHNKMMLLMTEKDGDKLYEAWCAAGSKPFINKSLRLGAAIPLHLRVNN